MFKKYANRFNFYVEKVAARIECIEFRKIHRYFLTFFYVGTTAVCILFTSLMFLLHQPTHKDLSQLSNLPNTLYQLPSGEYRIVSVDKSSEEHPFILVAPMNGGVVIAAKPADGSIPSKVLNNYTSYKLKISEKGSWLFYSLQDAHYGHPVASEKDDGRTYL